MIPSSRWSPMSRAKPPAQSDSGFHHMPTRQWVCPSRLGGLTIFFFATSAAKSWVERSLRGRGQATQLVTAAEAQAIARGCTGAFLGTFSFQARPLYEMLGYRVFGEEKDHPRGYVHYLMTKRLSGVH